MKLLVHLFGWPHELLHLLALWLVGRRAVSITQTHVDIPDDLTTRQYVFVAGLPALVYWVAFGLCMQALVGARGFTPVLGWFALTSIAGLAALGTIGDLYLIALRLLDNKET